MRGPFLAGAFVCSRILPSRRPTTVGRCREAFRSTGFSWVAIVVISFLIDVGFHSPGDRLFAAFDNAAPSSEPVLKTALPETASLLRATPPFAPAANPTPSNRQIPGPMCLPSPVLSQWAARKTTSRDQTASRRGLANQANQEHVRCHASPPRTFEFFHIRAVRDTKCPVLDRRPPPLSLSSHSLGRERGEGPGRHRGGTWRKR